VLTTLTLVAIIKLVLFTEAQLVGYFMGVKKLIL